MKTSNLAIVFTDIKGFTERTGRQSYEENQRMLRLHDALLVPVFRAFDGRLIKTIGDAFLVVFPSPTRAVLCGIAIQDRLWDYNRRVEEPAQIHVRVAINQGEVREEKGDVYGEPVNIAARVEHLADAGEVVFTEAVYLAMNRAEVPAEDRGLHTLKGIARPVRVYRVPLGAYRLEPDGPPSVAPATGPPYGGFGLARAGKLPPSDPESLARETEIVPQLLAAGAAAGTALADGASSLSRAFAPTMRTAGVALASRADRLSPRLRAAWSRAAARLRALPRRLQLVLAAAVALILLSLSVSLLRGDAVERAISRGDLRAARAEARRLPKGPARTYDEGRIDEAQGDLGDAAARYAAAARGGERRGYRRLVQLTKSAGCASRAAGARALGELGDRGAISALEAVESGSFPDEGDDSALGSLFGCSSRRAARDALARLRGAD